MRILDEGYRKARKPHYCDAWQYLDDYRCEIEDIEPCQGIKKGDMYFFQTNTHTGGIRTFKECNACMQSSKRHNILLCDEY